MGKGLKPDSELFAYAALKRRSSTSPALLLWRESTKERLCILANLG
jgi:hypothetical protein